MPAEKMLSPEQAQQIVLDHISPTGAELVPLLAAQGRVLAEDIAARYDNPPLDNSAMDGYALRFADVQGAGPQNPVALEMIEDIPAGHIGQKRVGLGQCSRIMTGAPVPAGADTVIPVEDTRLQGDRVEILDPDEAGANVRRRGDDMRQGQQLIAAGTPCASGEIGVMAVQQRAFVGVHRRPVLAILSTGDELVDIDQPLAEGKIVNSNTYGLAALARAAGAEARLLPTAPDDETQIRRSVEAALECDFIVSSGGVSVGEYDFVKKVLDDMGAEAKLWRVAMKPGKPLFFAMLQGKPYFGLPGNPVSSLMSFLQFVRPAVRKALGYAADVLLLPEIDAVLDNSAHNRGDRRQYLRAGLRLENGVPHAKIFEAQGSHILTSMLGVGAIVVLEPEQSAAAGAKVRVQVVGDLG
jgi:molybdopterin molybdotransferase